LQGVTISPVEDAQRDLERATQAALAQLRESTDYIRARAAADSAQGRLATLRKSRSLGDPELADASGFAMAAFAKVKEMENEWLATSPAVKAARDRLRQFRSR
jgi:hypothetical protein